jgi:hypothetical protein
MEQEQRSLSAEDLLGMLWPAGQGDEEKEAPEPNLATVRAYVSKVRALIGVEHLPFGGRGYQLVGLSSDWAEFRAAVASASSDPQREWDLLVKALTLVRGVPFSPGPTVGEFGWAHEGDALVGRMEQTIEPASHRLWVLSSERRDAGMGVWAAERGLAGSPNASLLHAHRVVAAQATGDRAALERARRGAERVGGVAALADLMARWPWPTTPG